MTKFLPMDSDFVGLEEGYFSSAVLSPKQSHNAQHVKN